MTLVSEVSSISSADVFRPAGTSPAQMVPLLHHRPHAQDGYRFVIDDRAAHESPTIKAMIARGDGGGFVEAESNTARLQIRYVLLQQQILRSTVAIHLTLRLIFICDDTGARYWRKLSSTSTLRSSTAARRKARFRTSRRGSRQRSRSSCK